MKKTFIEKSLVAGIVLLLFICSPYARALEFQVDKGVAYNFTAPIENLSNYTAFPTGLNNTAFYIDINNTNTWTQAATNITGTHPYLFQLNTTETNGTGDVFSIKYNLSGCWQFLKFNTKVKEAIDAVKTETASILEDTGTTLPASLGGLTNVTLAATQTGVTIPTVTAVTNAVVLPTGTGAGQIALSSGAVTVGTNNDKTGYTASTVSDKTGYSLAGTQAFNMTGSITGDLSGSVGSVTGNVGGNVTGSVASVVGNVTVTNCDVATSTRGTSNLTATDNIGINWADVSNPTTAVNLSGTNIKTDQIVASVTGNVSAVTNPVSLNITTIE